MRALTDPAKLQVMPEHVPKFRGWLAARGGLAVWDSQDLGNLGASCTTPALAADGSPTPTPGWQYGDTPTRVVTDPGQVEVLVDEVVKRFHVGVQRACSGFAFTLTEAATRRVRAEVAKAGPDARHAFDYEAHENCLILRPVAVVPLPQYEAWSCPWQALAREGKS